MVIEIENGDGNKDIVDVQNCIHSFVKDNTIIIMFYRHDSDVVIHLADENDANAVNRIIMNEVKSQIARGGFKCNGYLKIYRTNDMYTSYITY